MKKVIKSGYIYIISNPAHKGYIKIGITDDIKNRLHTYQTGDPNRAYKVEHYIYHPNCIAAEKQIKESMKYFAKSIKKEWYECDLCVAKVRLDELLSDLENENIKS